MNRGLNHGSATFAQGEVKMADKLNLLDTFPQLTLSLVGGDTMTLPDDIDTPYAIVLFYRGHW
jgi:hypothetical protein